MRGARATFIPSVAPHTKPPSLTHFPSRSPALPPRVISLLQMTRPPQGRLPREPLHGSSRARIQPSLPDLLLHEKGRSTRRQDSKSSHTHSSTRSRHCESSHTRSSTHRRDCESSHPRSSTRSWHCESSHPRGSTRSRNGESPSAQRLTRHQDRELNDDSGSTYTSHGEPPRL